MGVILQSGDRKYSEDAERKKTGNKEKTQKDET
jgi:hypothetical protein